MEQTELSTIIAPDFIGVSWDKTCHFCQFYAVLLADCGKPVPWQSWSGIHGQRTGPSVLDFGFSTQLTLLLLQSLVESLEGRFQHQLLSVLHNLWGWRLEPRSLSSSQIFTTLHNLACFHLSWQHCDSIVTNVVIPWVIFPWEAEGMSQKHFSCERKNSLLRLASNWMGSTQYLDKWRHRIWF